MRRSLALVAVWVLAAMLAAGVAWAGIGVVGNQVTDDRPPPLSADEIARRVAAGQQTSTSAPPPGGSTTTTAGPPADATTKTYPLVGGTVTLRFSAAGVSVVAATPNQGFDVDWEPEHGNGVRVEFESDQHESRIDAWWDGGPHVEPRENGAEVETDDDDGDDDGDDGSGDDDAGVVRSGP